MRLIEILLREQDVEKAENFVKSVLEDLLNGRVELSKLIISKGLSKTEEAYAKGGTKQQHVELAKRIAERCGRTGETPYQTGDRVPYVMIPGTKESKAHERAEDPVYVQQNGIPIDTHYYIHKQVWPAVIRVMTAVHEPKRCAEIKSSMSMRQRESLIAHQRLFLDTLDHMRGRKSKQVTNNNYFITKTRCVECGVVSDKLCCDNCEGLVGIKWKAKVQGQFEKAQADRLASWNKCLKCIDTQDERDVMSCGNKTCANLYTRYRCQKDLEDIQKTLQRI